MRAEAAEPGVDRDVDMAPAEEVEEYERGMSPVLIDFSRLPFEERQIDVIEEKEDRRALVRYTMDSYAKAARY